MNDKTAFKNCSFINTDLRVEVASGIEQAQFSDCYFK
jgi:hypothetical protein